MSVEAERKTGLPTHVVKRMIREGFVLVNFGGNCWCWQVNGPKHAPWIWHWDDRLLVCWVDCNEDHSVRVSDWPGAIEAALAIAGRPNFRTFPIDALQDAVVREIASYAEELGRPQLAATIGVVIEHLAHWKREVERG